MLSAVFSEICENWLTEEFIALTIGDSGLDAHESFEALPKNARQIKHNRIRFGIRICSLEYLGNHLIFTFLNRSHIFNHTRNIRFIIIKTPTFLTTITLEVLILRKTSKAFIYRWTTAYSMGIDVFI